MDRPSFRLLRRSLPLLVAAALAPACSDAPLDVESDDALTEGEAYALANQLGLAALGAGRNQGARSSASAAHPVSRSSTETVSVTYGSTWPCLLGGSVSSSGQITMVSDDVTDLAIVDVVATEVHHACVLPAGTARISVTGDPDLTTTIHAESLAGEARGTQTVAVAGAFTWVADDGRSGRCSLDILVEVDTDHATQITRGDVCGFTFDVTVVSS